MFDVRKKKWSELTAAQRWMILTGAVVQLLLQAATLWDLRRRSADELRGSKRWWTAAAFVNTVGPIAYFAVGRRSGHFPDLRPARSGTLARGGVLPRDGGWRSGRC
jgi:hypothetical protein